jgi:hypothetical protein
MIPVNDPICIRLIAKTVMRMIATPSRKRTMRTTKERI